MRCCLCPHSAAWVTICIQALTRACMRDWHVQHCCVHVPLHGPHGHACRRRQLSGHACMDVGVAACSACNYHLVAALDRLTLALVMLASDSFEAPNANRPSALFPYSTSRAPLPAPQPASRRPGRAGVRPIMGGGQQKQCVQCLACTATRAKITIQLVYFGGGHEAATPALHARSLLTSNVHVSTLLQRTLQCARSHLPMHRARQRRPLRPPPCLMSTTTTPSPISW